MNLGELRENYTKGGIRTAGMDAHPFIQFEKWMEQAKEAQIIEPNAMTLATSNASGDVSTRTVLLKGLDELGFQFFTNYDSHKGQDLAANPKASITILWKELERQVCLQGVVEKTSREISAAYFHSRPYGSQIGAWVSEKQSGSIPDRAYLETRDAELRQKFPESEEVPLPDFWGGYRLIPTVIEFWQGRPSRLHDRLSYRKNGDTWEISRLSP